MLDLGSRSEIQFKLFSPRKSVRDRLELVRAFDVVLLHEMMALLANANSHFSPAA